MMPDTPLTPSRWLQIKALFDACQDLPLAQRSAYLAGVEPDLRLLVEAMLTWDETIVQGFDDAPPPATLPDRIGPYQVINFIASSHTSVVLKAIRQDGQFDQTVAIKLLQPIAATPTALLRLQSERRILATLNHPSICRLLDSGQLPSGQHYLVLEWIEGTPFLEHAKDFSLRSRLELFLDICRVVEAAHRLLVIHRDLKPAHILVTADGLLKILDFGIAKLLPALNAEDSRLTQSGESPLTPAYAAPEQWRGEPASAAMDVFSLGILLSEFLTGQHPFGPSPALPHEWANRITTGQPQVSRTLPTSLGALAAKAVAPRTQDRYSSVEALRLDIENYLTGRPVSARPANPLISMGLWMRRNRKYVIAAALLIALAGREVQQYWLRRNAELDRAAAAQESARQLVLQTFEALSGTSVPNNIRRQILYSAIQQLEWWEAASPSEVERREIATLYGRIAANLGEGFADHLEDYPQAEICARRNFKLWQSLPSATAMERISARMLFADILFSHSRFSEANEHYRHCALELRALPDADSLPNQLSLTVMESMQGDILLAEGNAAASLAIQQAVLAKREQLLPLIGKTVDGQPMEFPLGNVHLSLAQSYAALQQLPLAVSHASQAVDYYRIVVKLAPHTRELISGLLLQGDLLAQSQQRAEAQRAWREAESIAQVQLAKDPANIQRQRLVQQIQQRLKESGKPDLP